MAAKKQILIVFAGIAVFAAVAFNYSNTSALEQVTADYYTNLKQLEKSLLQLKNIAADEKTETEVIKKQFLKVRADYKNIEFLLEYFDSYSVKDYINGAPLPKIERASTDMTVVQPHGLQVIEELLFAAEMERQALENEIAILYDNYLNVLKYQLVQQVTERQLYEAARLQLIRVATLGVTGFDTPGSHNALADAKNSLLPLLKMARAYTPQLNETGAKLENILLATLKYLDNNTDFDSFNRFVFIKEYLNPAFKLFKDAQLQLGIETIYEVNNQKLALNYLADNFFDDNLLNTDYFSLAGDTGINPAKAALGKYLFFDPVLSANNKRACASCHIPGKAFTDGQPRSTAMDLKGTVARNAPTLLNCVLADRYFYDLRADKIENQFEHVITSPLEFNTTYPEIAIKLAQSKAYKKMFADAFPNQGGQINKQSISESIGAYLKTLVSYNSEFDKNIRGEASNLSPEVVNGFNLFMGKAVCGTCHFAPTFSGLVPPYYNENESEVLGVPDKPDTANATLDADIGRYGGRMKEKADINRHAFKTVSVRNVALTAPYMHNGAYNTLEQVVDFYKRGGGSGIGIHLDNQTLPFDSLALSQKEMNAIIAFMNSLTDTAGLTSVPATLPIFENKPEWNKRAVGGEY